MSKTMVQIRNVPLDTHRLLKARAAIEGLSMSDYILREIRKALERVTGYDKVYDTLVGPTGIAFCGDDVAAPAKIIKKFFDKTGKFRLKAAVLEKQVYDGSKIATLAQIPSRKELIAGILGTLQSPASGIVGAINALARDLVSIVGQIADKKKAA